MRHRPHRRSAHSFDSAPPLLWLVILLVISSLMNGGAAAQMARDSSLGQRSGALTGPQYAIDVQNAAQQIHGNNLFHSFSEFNVKTGESATFTGPAHIANIINRVTGQNASTIDGAINARAAMPNANLFLMNPNGVMVGPHASFNVGGSIHLTTADYVRLADGAQFFASLAKQSTLTSAPVTAFGFLGERPTGPLTVQPGSPIRVDQGQAVSLVGGEVSIAGRTIAAPGGQIEVVSIAGIGEHAVGGIQSTAAGPAVAASPATVGGTIRLIDQALLQTSSDVSAAGSILIKGGRLVMDHAALEATTSAQDPLTTSNSAAQGHIAIHADTVSLSNGSTISTATSGNQKAGNIQIEAATLRSNVGEDGTPITGGPPVIISSSSTGNGGAGTISIAGAGGAPADVVSLSNTQIAANVTATTIPTPSGGGGEEIATAYSPDFVPKRLPAVIEITAEQVRLVNGTAVRADTTGGADAGSIRFSVGSLTTHEGPDGRVLISSTSNCGEGCFGGQAGNIIVEGIKGVTPTSTRAYVWVPRPQAGLTEVFEYYLARGIDLQGTDISSEAVGNAPGGMVLMRAHGPISLTDTKISVATQDFEINGNKPNGEPAFNQGFSRIDMLASDVSMKDSLIKADANVSEIGSCPTCTGGPSAGEIWVRVHHSLTMDNSAITNTSRGRAQAGLTKIIKDHHFSYGAIWEPDYPDQPTEKVSLTNSEITVESLDTGLPGYLRIRADQVILDHSVLNSRVNDVSNGKSQRTGEATDIVGAGERGRVLSDGRDVQGSIVVSAKTLDITGGGIIAPTQGDRIGSRIELYADQITTRPGTHAGGTHDAPRILDPSDPTRVVISSSSTGDGGAGRILFAGESVPMPEGTPPPLASSIRLQGTNVMTDTTHDALGGKIEMKAKGPIELRDSTISANVTDVRPQSAHLQEQGGNIDIVAGSLLVEQGGMTALSRGTQTGGNIVVTVQGPVTIRSGGSISANGIGSGDAGSIKLEAAGPVLLDAGRVATTSAEGHGGSITLRGSDVTLTNDASITAESYGAKNGGKIELTAEHDIALTGSTVSTQALKASGGDIKLTAPDTITLRESTITASVAGGNETTGGKIDIDPQYVVIQNSQVLAKAADGQGGRIAVDASQAVLVDPGSQIDATSSKGVSGEILIRAPIQQLAGAIAPLVQAFAVSATLYGQRCAAQKGSQVSSFVQGARDGVPPQPGDRLASPLLLASDEGFADRGPNPAARRLGLPDFAQMTTILSPAVSGCRS